MYGGSYTAGGLTAGGAYTSGDYAYQTGGTAGYTAGEGLSTY